MWNAAHSSSEKIALPSGKQRAARGEDKHANWRDAEAPPSSARRNSVMETISIITKKLADVRKRRAIRPDSRAMEKWEGATEVAVEKTVEKAAPAELALPAELAVVSEWVEGGGLLVSGRRRVLFVRFVLCVAAALYFFV